MKYGVSHKASHGPSSFTDILYQKLANKPIMFLFKFRNLSPSLQHILITIYLFFCIFLYEAIKMVIRNEYWEYSGQRFVSDLFICLTSPIRTMFSI